MMKSLALILLLLTFQNSAWADWHEVHVKSREAGVDITTNKVLDVYGPIMPGSSIVFMMEQMVTSYLPGDRIVIINSPGGDEQEGRLMIDALLTERSLSGGKLICVVNKYAHSMAFNLTSYCDIRLTTRKAQCLVHKIACYADSVERPTAKNLRERASKCESYDERYRDTNMHAMHLTEKQYDDTADAETMWDAETLINLKYFQGYATIERGSSKK